MAGPLIVCDTEIFSKLILSNNISISLRGATLTPHLPTSPNAKSCPGSYPIKVGISKATERPVCPCESKK